MLSAPDPLRTPASAAPIDCAIPGGPPPLPPAEGVALEGRIRAPPSGVKGTADLSFLVEADVDLREKKTPVIFFDEDNGFARNIKRTAHENDFLRLHYINQYNYEPIVFCPVMCRVLRTESELDQIFSFILVYQHEKVPGDPTG